MEPLYLSNIEDIIASRVQWSLAVLLTLSSDGF